MNPEPIPWRQLTGLDGIQQWAQEDLMPILPRLGLGLVLISLPLSAADKLPRITVSSGDMERRDTVVSVPALPAEAQSARMLRDSSGAMIPFQIDAAGQGTFIERALPKGTIKTYQLVRGDSQRPAVTAMTEGGQVQLNASGRPVLTYQFETGDLPRPDIKPIFRRAGYLHPVYSPAGVVVTDDYPPNHVHHHGIWAPWTKTEFEGRHPDFWNMGEGTGTVEADKLLEAWEGPVYGGVSGRHRFVDLSAKPSKVALWETWEVRVYGLEANRRYFMFDLVSTQQCATASPLVLPQYHYGGLGFRGNWQWNGKDKTDFLTSEGETDRVRGNETRARWCYLSGKVDGKTAGILILGHPDNFRAPQPMRLHPSEPFFCYAPSQLGPWQIDPDKPYVARYRFVVRDGPADRNEFERFWRDYATPPPVELEH